jgi:hypothetical protein
MRLSLKSTLSLPGCFGLDGVPKTVDIADSDSAAEAQFEQIGASLTETLAFSHRRLIILHRIMTISRNRGENCSNRWGPQLHLVKH